MKADEVMIEVPYENVVLLGNYNATLELGAQESSDKEE